MYERAKQFTLGIPLLRKSLGWLFLLTGIIAFITPFTPGAIILTLIGLELIGLELLFAKKLKAKLVQRKQPK